MGNKITQAVILAGGRGERLRPFTDMLPKPMYPIDGLPFIERLVLQIVAFGIKRIMILLGYKAQEIINLLGNGRKYGVLIQYDITPLEFDTGDRLLHARNLLQERFLLMYCDNYCPIDYGRLVSDSYKNKAMIQLSVYANKDHYTKDNVSISEKSGNIIVYDRSRLIDGLHGVDIGYAIVRKEALDELPNAGGSFSAVYAVLAGRNQLYATVTEHRYYSIGSYDRLELTKEFFKPKLVAFLDRDGTLNIKPPKACYVEKPEDFKWLPGAIEAVKLLNKHNIITVIVSNQSGIARGNLTLCDLDEIHKKMQLDLRKYGAKIDYIYFCPHNWDEECDCRKPRPGMLYQAQRDLSLNLPECIFFGDDERDMIAGQAAGCKTVLIKNDYSLLDAVKDYLGEIKKYDYFENTFEGLLFRRRNGFS